MFDYDKQWYSQQFHGCGKQELMVDKTLSYFSYICYLERYKIITDKEFDFFKYEIKSILKNQEIHDYFYNLYHYSNKLRAPFTLKYLFEYGEKLGLFDADFYDRDAYKKTSTIIITWVFNITCNSLVFFILTKLYRKGEVAHNVLYCSMV